MPQLFFSTQRLKYFLDVNKYFYIGTIKISFQCYSNGKGEAETEPSCSLQAAAPCLCPPPGLVFAVRPLLIGGHAAAAASLSQSEAAAVSENE